MSSSVPLHSDRFKRSDRFVYRHVAGEHLLIDLHSKARVPYFLLTATAAAIWERLEAWASIEELATALTTRFNVGDQEAVTDVTDFLAQLDSVGGLVRASAGA